MPDYNEEFRQQVIRSGATKTFDFYADPGHGWLKVPKKLLKQLGIADRITPYSYQRGDSAYLEEDLDAPTFVNAMMTRYGVVVKYREHIADNDSKIRSYDQYDPKGGPDSIEEEQLYKALHEQEFGFKAQSCPSCGYGMSKMGDRYVCASCGATTGEYRPREPMRRPEVRVRGHQRRSK